MGYLAWIVVGAVAGFLATVVMGYHEGLVMMILLGIVGGLLGGFIATSVLAARARPLATLGSRTRRVSTRSAPKMAGSLGRSSSALNPERQS